MNNWAAGVQQFFYRIGVRSYGWLIFLAQPFSSKARLWIEGRRNWEIRLREKLPSTLPYSQRYWFHCASLGEFEQGRPVMEAVRDAHPDAQIFLSFFSPSGYEIRKDYPIADLVFYLPLDTPRNARKLLQIVQPDLLIMVKYEFWFYLLQRAAHQQVPIFLVSGLFREKHWMFKHAKALGKRMLANFRHFYLQDEASAALLLQQGFTNNTVTGDCRVDRVLEMAQTPKDQPLLSHWAAKAETVLVAGSTWEPDEQLLAELLAQPVFQDWKVILAPHDISESHLRRIQQKWPRPINRYTSGKLAGDCLLDTIGDLGSAYQFAHLAYIGGGFGDGIHNTLEPAAYRIPILFGPNYQKFTEAVELQQQGAAQAIRSARDTKQALQHFRQPDQQRKVRSILNDFFQQQAGATSKILQHWEELF
jgi:3-deoxy-D-manno-octulosonic-acid transferase